MNILAIHVPVYQFGRSNTYFTLPPMLHEGSLEQLIQCKIAVESILNDAYQEFKDVALVGEQKMYQASTAGVDSFISNLDGAIFGKLYFPTHCKTAN